MASAVLGEFIRYKVAGRLYMNEKNAQNATTGQATQQRPQQAKAELSFVTKKYLVTFRQQICIMLNDTPVFTQIAICEYQEQSDDGARYADTPKEFLIVGLPDGKKLTHALKLRLEYGGIFAMIEL